MDWHEDVIAEAVQLPVVFGEDGERLLHLRELSGSRHLFSSVDGSEVLVYHEDSGDFTHPREEDFNDES